MKKYTAQTQLRKPGREITATLAENLRALRRDRKLSQEALAEVCGLHRTYVGSVERGERNVTLSSLEAFACALNVSVPILLTRKEPNERNPEAK